MSKMDGAMEIIGMWLPKAEQNIHSISMVTKLTPNIGVLVNRTHIQTAWYVCCNDVLQTQAINYHTCQKQLPKLLRACEQNVNTSDSIECKFIKRIFWRSDRINFHEILSTSVSKIDEITYNSDVMRLIECLGLIEKRKNDSTMPRNNAWLLDMCTKSHWKWKRL